MKKFFVTMIVCMMSTTFETFARTTLTDDIYSTQMLRLSVSQFAKTTPTDDIYSIIDATEKKLHTLKSFEAVSDMQFAFLDNITNCLNKKHRRYRYVAGSKEYKKVMKRFERFNVVYCMVMSKFNPELNVERGNRDKVIRVLAIMKRMEHQAITAPNGFKP